jgi:hypothetical protein
MISQPLRDKGGDLVTQEFDEERKTIDLTIKAEGIIASAFYLFPLIGCESKQYFLNEISSQS